MKTLGTLAFAFCSIILSGAANAQLKSEYPTYIAHAFTACSMALKDKSEAEQYLKSKGFKYQRAWKSYTMVAGRSQTLIKSDQLFGVTIRDRKASLNCTIAGPGGRAVSAMFISQFQSVFQKQGHSISPKGVGQFQFANDASFGTLSVKYTRGVHAATNAKLKLKAR